jgi:hypothetical protein
LLEFVAISPLRSAVSAVTEIEDVVLVVQSLLYVWPTVFVPAYSDSIMPSDQQTFSSYD